MPIIVPKVFVNQSEVDAAVERAAAALADIVVRIRYDFGSDWTGDPSIFFRVTLTDEVVNEPKLGKIANAIELAVIREVKPQEYGWNWYFNFRSASEQAELKDPAWA